MFIVMGATGHVGGAVAEGLLSQGERVTVLTREPRRASKWRDRGACVVAADAEDVGSLREAFRLGRRAFLLNPPADPSGDTQATERRTIANILAALEESRLEKVVAASTYGARAGEGIGDLTTLWELEEGLRRQPIPAAINRGAYYMTNWTSATEVVRQSGRLPSMFPGDAVMPMVAPLDLGQAAIDRLVAGVDDSGVRYVEGPARYTPHDVAKAFARALGHDVAVDVVPPAEWRAVFKGLGFSDEAALSYERMTRESLDGDFDKPANPICGAVTLQRFISDAIRPVK